MDETFLINCITYFTFIVIAIFCYIRYVYTYFANKNTPNGPSPTFPFGNIMEMVFFQNATFHEEMHKIYKHCKRKVFKYCGMYLFLKPAVFIFDPKLIVKSRNLDVFKKNCTMYCNNRNTIFNEIVQNETVKQYTIKYKNITPVVTKMNYGKIVQTCRNWIDDELIKYTRTSASVNIMEVLKNLTTNISTICILGVNQKVLFEIDKNLTDSFLQSLRPNNYWENTKGLFGYVYPGMLNYFKLETRRKSCFNKIVKRILDKHDTGSKCNVLTLIADLAENDKETVVNYNDLAQFGCDVWLENLETLNAMLVYCLYELSSNEEVQGKLVDELNEFKHDFDLESIEKLNYLDLVVNETFRKYPLIFTETKLCQKTFEISDLKVNKGNYVVLPLSEIYRDPQYYPMPHIFNPDRIYEYVKNEKLLPEDEEYFLGNSENFAGLSLLKQQMKIIITQLFKSVRLYIDEKTFDQVQFDEAGFLIYTNKPMWMKVQEL